MVVARLLVFRVKRVNFSFKKKRVEKHKYVNFNPFTSLVFPEPLPTCAARVDTLRSHGLVTSALRLTVAVVRTMKAQQLLAQRRWHEVQAKSNAASSSGSSSGAAAAATSPTNQSPSCTSRCRSSHCYDYYRSVVFSIHIF